jgi:hypothetical protein
MRMSGLHVDMDAVVAQLNRARVPAVDKVSALSVGWSSQTQTPFSDSRGSGIATTTRRLHLFGGVDLSVAPKVENNSRGRVPSRSGGFEAAAVRCAGPIRADAGGARLSSLCDAVSDRRWSWTVEAAAPDTVRNDTSATGPRLLTAHT